MKSLKHPPFSQKLFLLNDNLPSQTDGLAMGLGSSVSPSFANFFLGHHECIKVMNLKRVESTAPPLNICNTTSVQT